MKSVVHRVLLMLEYLVEKLRFNRSSKRHVDPYIGYATSTHLVARGRVLSRNRARTPQPDQSRLRNLWDMLTLFFTDEAAGVKVRGPHSKTVTDDEGYFQLTLPKTSQSGWTTCEVAVDGAEGTTACPVYVPQPDARFLVISDIDDTVLQTRAYSLWQNLFTSFTGNVLTRRIFPDAVKLMQRLSRDGQNPIFYVSSSPWNMHAFLDDIFKRAQLERGPMFLRDLGLSETKLITDGHESHKGLSIDRILDANPGLPAVLIGDTGQEDASIYRHAVRRHPDRIAVVVLRHADPDLGAAERQNIERLRQLPLPVFIATSFDEISHDLMSELWGTEADQPVELKT